MAGHPKYRNFAVRGKIYATVNDAAQDLGVTGHTVRVHIRAKTLDRLGLPQRRNRMRVRVRGQDFETVKACAAHFGLSPNTVYDYLLKGRADDIGCPDKDGRGMHGAVPVSFGPVSFLTIASAARALGVSRQYLWRVLRSGSETARARMYERAMAYAMREAAT